MNKYSKDYTQAKTQNSLYMEIFKAIGIVILVWILVVLFLAF